MHPPQVEGTCNGRIGYVVAVDAINSVSAVSGGVCAAVRQRARCNAQAQCAEMRRALPASLHANLHPLTHTCVCMRRA